MKPSKQNRYYEPHEKKHVPNLDLSKKRYRLEIDGFSWDAEIGRIYSADSVSIEISRKGRKRTMIVNPVLLM